MRQLNPEWVKTITGVVNNCPYFDLQSMIIRDLTPGRSLLEIQVGRKHLQPFGLVHGGVFSSLIDAAGWWAVFTETEEQVGMATLEMKLNYLAPSADGLLIGRGQCIKLGSTIGLADARVENQDGRLLAHGTVTVMLQPDLKMDRQEHQPSKFL